MKLAYDYTHCLCGVLVRLARIPDDTEAGKAVAAAGAVGFIGACPHCKCELTLTLKPASPIVRPSLSLSPSQT